MDLRSDCQNLPNLSVTSALTLASTMMSAVATALLVFLTWREVRKLSRTLGESKFLAADLHELLLEGSVALDQPWDLPSQSGGSTSILRRVESATHLPSYERVVFEFAGQIPGISVTPLRLEDMGRIGVAGACGVTLTFNPATSSVPGAQDEASSRPVKTLRRNLQDIQDVHEESPEPPTLVWHIGVRSNQLRYRLTRISGRRVVVDIFRA